MGRTENEDDITNFFSKFPFTINTNIRQELDDLWMDNKDFLILEPEEKFCEETRERVYSHSSTADSWIFLHKTFQKEKPDEKIALQLIINYSDKTNHKNKSFWPAYLTLANLPKKLRDLDENKILAGFFPIFNSNMSTMLEENYKLQVKVLYQEFWNQIIMQVYSLVFH